MGDVSGDKGVSRERIVSMWPVTLKPKFPKIFSWYLVWGCIRGQRCVSQKICGDVIFDLDPVTMTPNFIIFLFRSIIPKRLTILGWYLVGGCFRGQRCAARKYRVDATFDLPCGVHTRRDVTHGVAGLCLHSRRCAKFSGHPGVATHSSRLVPGYISMTWLVLVKLFFFFFSVRSCLEELFSKEYYFYERFCVPLRLGANWGYWPSDSIFDQLG
jgi:hypothetical protein